MFEPTSRYANIGDATIERKEKGESNGAKTTKVITYRYKKRRFIPAGKQPVLFKMTMTAGDRLDQITARYLGDPEQYWQICDANLDGDDDAMHPLDLTEVGRVLNIPLPKRG